MTKIIDLYQQRITIKLENKRWKKNKNKLQNIIIKEGKERKGEKQYIT